MLQEDRMVRVHQPDRYLGATAGCSSMPRTLQLRAYGRAMSTTRYGHSSASGGNQDQGERKDEGWESRQGGDQSRDSGPDRGRSEGAAAGGGHEGGPSSTPPAGTNTQGELAGIRDASRQTLTEERGDRDEERATGTDQPPREGGPLGLGRVPRLGQPAQDAQTRGTGAGGFDRGVNAKVIGAVHQGAREEDVPDRG